MIPAESPLTRGNSLEARRPAWGPEMLTPHQAAQAAIRAVMAVNGPGSPRPTERRRSKEVVSLRHAAIWVAAQLAPHASLPELAKAFGGLHHTSVLYALRRIGSRANLAASALAASALQLARHAAELARAEQGLTEQGSSSRALEAALRALLHACRQVEICARELLPDYDPQPEGTPTVPRQPEASGHGNPSGSQPEPTAHAPWKAPATVVAADEPIRCRERGCVMPAARHGYCRQHWAMRKDPTPFLRREPLPPARR
jgi:hypothetical protein